MPFGERDGLRLYYERAGSGEPPVVFVHGWCCDHTYFEPQFDHFARSHSVVALDLRGFGQSGRAKDGYDRGAFADDVAWLCDELGLSRPVVVGHSLGGAVAIELGARHPALPAGIVALAPGPIDPPDALREMMGEFAEQLHGPEAETARREFIENFLFIETDDKDRKGRIVEQMCSAPIDVAAAATAAGRDWDGGEALKALNAPTLILLSRVGIDDPARLRALKPDVHIGVSVGAGHFNQLEVPEQVTPMIERFMEVVVRSTPSPA